MIEGISPTPHESVEALDDAGRARDSFTERLRDARVGQPPDDKLMDACRNLEALLWQQVIASMRQAYEVEGGVLGGGTDSAIWQGQLDQTWASSMAGGPQGLSSTLYRQLQKRLSACQQLPEDPNNA